MISCTGATASRNYMPALTEAYYRKLPILAVTSCRDIAWVGQNSPQQIDRSVQPKDIVRYSLHLPTLHNKQEEDRYTTLINKAILELSKMVEVLFILILPTATLVNIRRKSCLRFE